LKYFGNISVFNEIFQNTMPLCTSCLFLPHGAMAQHLVTLNTWNCFLPVKWFYFQHTQIICDFHFQIKNIKTLNIWLFKLSQVTTCSQSQHSQTKSVTVSQSQTDSTCRKPQINRLLKRYLNFNYLVDQYVVVIDSVIIINLSSIILVVILMSHDSWVQPYDPTIY